MRSHPWTLTVISRLQFALACPQLVVNENVVENLLPIDDPHLKDLAPDQFGLLSEGIGGVVAKAYVLLGDTPTALHHAHHAMTGGKYPAREVHYHLMLGGLLGAESMMFVDEDE